MTNEENPVTSLTREEIVKIYSGEITRWSQVGGEDVPIVPFQRNENAGSQTAMKSLVMNGREMADPKELRIYTMSDLLEAVASYNNQANALGYSYYYYASQMYRTPGLRFMAVDQVLPTNETVRSGAYPYIAGYYAVIRKDEGDTPARRIFDWLSGREGQELIADLGYVPVDVQADPGRIHADEQAEGKLPIGEDECLAIVTGKTMLTFIDNDGRIMDRLGNAALGGYADNIVSAAKTRVQIVKKDKPLPVMMMKTGEEKGTDDLFLVGMYLPSEGRFTIEPTYSYLRPLGDGLVTDSSPVLGTGVLMKTDGTVLSDTQDTFYWEAGEVIIGYSYMAGRTAVYDKEGRIIYNTEGSFSGYIADGVILFSDGYGYKTADTQGSRLWEGREGYFLIRAVDGYLVWASSDMTRYEVTDIDGNLLLDGDRFREANPQAGLLEVRPDITAVSRDKGLVLVADAGDNMQNIYLCDRDFHILEYLRYDEIIWESSPESSFLHYAGQIPWRVRAEDGTWTFSELFGERTFSVSEDPELTGTLTRAGAIQSIGNILLANLSNSEYESVEVCLAGERELVFRNAWCSGEKYENAVRIISLADNEEDFLLSTEDGSVIAENGNGIIYNGDRLKAVKRGAYLYLENEEGALYMRLLAEDEEEGF